jgi:4-hydroxybenzoate polyprenyltransferase
MNMIERQAATEQVAKPTTPRATVSATVRDYISIARPDHWFKNVFMVIGVLLAYLYYPNLFNEFDLSRFAWALAAVCLVASSNYVLNEILDAPTDRSHPHKR